MSLAVAHEIGITLACCLAMFVVMAGGALPAPAWAALMLPPLSAALRSRGLRLPRSLGTLIGAGAMGLGALTLITRGVDFALVAGVIALLGLLAGRLLSRTPLPAVGDLTRGDDAAPRVVSLSKDAAAEDPRARLREALSHDMQALLVSLLLMFAGGLLYPQVTYGLLFIGYAITTTWALLTRQLIGGAGSDELDRNGVPGLRHLLRRHDVTTARFFAATGALASGILLTTLVVFLLFPRVGLGSLGLYFKGGARLPLDVSLSGAPRAGFGGEEVVARVRGLDALIFDRGLYLRAQVYDQLNADGFSRSPQLPSMPPSNLAVAAGIGPLTYEVSLQPVTEDRLLTLGPVDSARVVAGGSSNPSFRVQVQGVGPGGELLPTNPITGPLRYEVTGAMAQPGRSVVDEPPKPLRPWVEQHFLRLPPQLDPRIARLAQQLAPTSLEPDQRAAAARSFLLHNFTYSLSLPSATKPDPLAAFLFDDRQGHCEYFATAFAVLLRAAGVPSRVVGGYQGGTWDDEGQVAVFMGSNAHAWVEWFDPLIGWRVDDATPAADAPRQRLSGLAAAIERLRRAWDDYVVDYGLHEQIAMLRSLAAAIRPTGGERGAAQLLRGLLPICGILLAASLLLWGGRRLLRRRAARHGEHAVGAALSRAVEHVCAVRIAQHATLREAVQQLVRGLRDRAQAPAPAPAPAPEPAAGTPLATPARPAIWLTDRLDDAAALLELGLGIYERQRFGHAGRDARADARASEVTRRLQRLARAAIWQRWRQRARAFCMHR